MSKSVSDSSARHLGRVKWFNNKAGYGFLTVCGGERDNQDIFVHHSAVKVNEEQYRYLVQGEYVEFDLSKSDNTSHEWQAVNVKGVRGGLLMCETRFLNRQERDQNDDDGRPNRRRRNNSSRPRGGGPRSENPRRQAQRWVLDESNSKNSSEQHH